MVLALIFFGILISYIDRGNVSIAAPVLMHDFALSTGAMGLLLSAFFWTYGAFQLPAGSIVDRFGVRQSYFVAFLIWSLASAGTALSPNTQTIFGLRLLLGAAESVGPLASLAFIRHAFSERERGFPVATYIAGQTVGPACGALLGSALLAAAGWRVMFAVTGLGALLWLPFWLGFAKLGPNRVERASLPVKSPGWTWRAILSNGACWAMSGCVFLFSYYWYFLLTWIPTYLSVSRGLPVLTMGRIVAVPLFIMAPVNIAVGWLADSAISRYGHALKIRIVLAITGFLGAGTILMLPRAPGRLSVLAILTASACSFGFASANFWTIVQYVAPPHLTARVIACFNTLSQVGGAVAPVITGYTLGASKNFSVAITLAGLSTVAASGLLLVTGTRGVQGMKHLLES